ncbi:MAG: uroporphyrinogen decarboxylase family protein [Desulfobacterales bacterium]
MSISLRERFLGICKFERPGDLYIHDGFWSQTLKEWVEQGAPERIWEEEFRREYFQFAPSLFTPGLLDIRSGLSFTRGKRVDVGDGLRLMDYGIPPTIPSFEPQRIGEDERTITVINGAGQTVKFLKDSSGNMPMFMDWPVKDRASWNEYKKRLDPHTPERWPEDWDATVDYVNGLDTPITLQIGGFFGYLREWVGTERVLLMFYDDPALIEDMMDQMLYMEIEIIKRVTKDIKIDMGLYWEDMCYKAGPLISPDMVRKFMVPRYKQITELLHENGVEFIYLDCDGNVESLLPLWLECGINYTWPLEVAAGNDAVALRKTYGKDLILGGAIDKRALAKDRAAIKEEVYSKVPFLLESGGYFPTTDHAVPPDVSLDNYQYYINTMREVAGMGRIFF